MNNLQSLSYFYPELLLTIVILVAIIYDLFIDSSESGKVGWVLVFGLILVAISIWFQDSSKATTLFTDAIVLDPFSTFFKLIIILATIFVSIVSLHSGELENYRKGEYFSLLGIITFGLFLMVSSIDLIMVYVSIEIVSIMSFVLAGYLKKNTRSNEAALKYVVYGAFSSGIMLFGLSYIYGLTGSTNFFQIQQTFAASGPESNSAILIAVIMVLAGFGYKISAVPFHFWTPDVYEGAPTTITAYLSIAPKAGALAMMIRFFAMPVMSGESVYAIMVYLVMYLFMNLGAFFVVITVKNRTNGETFDDYKGLGWEMPIVGISMTLFMVSLTGLPPTAGFIGKFYIFASLIQGGSAFYWLVIIGGINSVISLYYYLRVVKVMYFDGERKDSLLFPPRVLSGMLLVTAIPTLILGIYWVPIAEWIQSSLVFFIQTI